MNEEGKTWIGMIYKGILSPYLTNLGDLKRIKFLTFTVSSMFFHNPSSKFPYDTQKPLNWGQNSNKGLYLPFFLENYSLKLLFLCQFWTDLDAVCGKRIKFSF